MGKTSKSGQVACVCKEELAQWLAKRMAMIEALNAYVWVDPPVIDATDENGKAAAALIHEGRAILEDVLGNFREACACLDVQRRVEAILG